MMAWADRLWFITYLSVPGPTNGTGLFSVDRNMMMTRVASHSSTYANRLLKSNLNVIVIGPYIIDAQGGVRTIEPLLTVRIGGMSEHLTDPDSVYMLGMDGPYWEVNLVTLAVKQLFDLTVALDLPPGEQAHFKAAHTVGGLTYVATNTYEQADDLGLVHGGRLASWDGASLNWTILERTAFFEITARKNFGCTLFASGMDDKSVKLNVLDTGCSDAPVPPDASRWQHYRLPKCASCDGGAREARLPALRRRLLYTFHSPRIPSLPLSSLAATHTHDHLWTTEWPRIREGKSRKMRDVAEEAQGMLRAHPQAPHPTLPLPQLRLRGI